MEPRVQLTDQICDDSSFDFGKGWGIGLFVVVIICGVYVVTDAIQNHEKRKVPGKLVNNLFVSRTVDYHWNV